MFLLTALMLPMVEFIDSRTNPNMTTVIVNNDECVFEIPKSMVKFPELVDVEMEKNCDLELIYGKKE